MTLLGAKWAKPQFSHMKGRLKDSLESQLDGVLLGQTHEGTFSWSGHRWKTETDMGKNVLLKQTQEKACSTKTSRRQVFTPDRNSRADQSQDAIKIWLGDPMSFIRATYRSVGEEQEQRWLKDSCITKAHPRMGKGSPKLDTEFTAWCAWSSTSLLPGSCVGLCSFLWSSLV